MISTMFRSSRRTTAAANGIFVRNFSDKKAKATKTVTAANPEDHRPLIHLNGLAARYANAAYVVASKANVLDKVESELNGLGASAAASPKFSDFLNNPLIGRDAKSSIIASMDKLSPITKNLLSVMAGNARLEELPKVVSTFSQLMKAKRGEVDAKIISAEPLSPAMLKEVQAAMQNQVPKGKTVIIEQVTDPSIVGGLQVQIGDQFLDLSIKSRVDEIARMPVS